MQRRWASPYPAVRGGLCYFSCPMLCTAYRTDNRLHSSHATVGVAGCIDRAAKSSVERCRVSHPYYHALSSVRRFGGLPLVEKRLPATMLPPQQRIAHQRRYHLSAPFFRFSFRFLQPYQRDLSYQPERMLPAI